MKGAGLFIVPFICFQRRLCTPCTSRSVHAEHGGAAVHDFRAPVGHHEGDGAAAALVDFAEFADLPGYAGFVEDGADLLEEFGVGVVAARFAAGAAVLGEGDAVAEEGGVVFFGDFSKHRVEAAVHVSGEHFAGFHGLVEVEEPAAALEGEEFHDEFHEVRGFHARIAVGADFFFVGEERRLGLRAGLRVEDGFHIGVGADPVVLAVGGDEGAVESDVAALHGGHEFEFRRGEVFFFDAVGVFQEFHDRFFRRFSFVGVRADDGLELFAGDAVGEGLFHLVLRHVDEQVGDVENGVVVFEADIDIDFFSVFREDDAAQGEGRAGPLVFLDAPVVVGAEVCSWTGLAFRSRRGASMWEPTILMPADTGSSPMTARMTDFPF